MNALIRMEAADLSVLARKSVPDLIAWAKSAIEEAGSFNELREIVAVSDAVKALRLSLGRADDAVEAAKEIKSRAERRMGTELDKLDRAKGGYHRHARNPSHPGTGTDEPTLRELGVTRKQAHTYRQLAKIPEPVFEETVEVLKEAGDLSRIAIARTATELGDMTGLSAAEQRQAVRENVLVQDGRKAKASYIYERDPHEWYVEPVWAVAGLLRHERFAGPVWDPACGGGNVLRACLAAGLDAYGSDKVRRVPNDLMDRFLGRHDFLDGDAARVPAEFDRVPRSFGRPHDMIFNPPFYRAKGTEAFIRRALTLATGKVAVFADVNFLAGQRRGAGLFADHCPHRVWIHSVRPSCPPGSYLAAGNEAGGGSEDWCWMVWDLSAAPVTRFEGGWIRPEAPATAERAIAEGEQEPAYA